MRLLIIKELSCLRTKNENKEQERRKERKKRSSPSSFYRRGLFCGFFFAWYCCVLCVELSYEVMHLVMLFALFCQTTRKFSQVFKLFFKNIWIGAVNVLPLQTLSGRNRVIDCSIPEARPESCKRLLPPKERVLWKDLHKQRSSTRSEAYSNMCLG